MEVNDKFFTEATDSLFLSRVHYNFIKVKMLSTLALRAGTVSFLWPRKNLHTFRNTEGTDTVLALK